MFISAEMINDANIKNKAATSISYIYREQEVITKSVHHAMNIMSIEAKLFAIRCGINHAVQLQDIAHIIVITDVILATK